MAAPGGRRTRAVGSIGCTRATRVDYQNSFNSQTFGVPFASQEPELMPSCSTTRCCRCWHAFVANIAAVVETEGPMRGTGGMRAGGSVSTLVPDPPGTCGYITCECNVEL